MKQEYDFSKGKRGAVVTVPPGKIRVTIRLDKDILEWFREQIDSAGGGNYQTLINEALREYMVERKDPLEETLRRVIREELKAGAWPACLRLVTWPFDTSVKPNCQRLAWRPASASAVSKSLPE